MGNYASCAFVAPKLRTPKSARVILPTGEVRQFRHAVKAAELMLEAPNFFVVNSKSLAINRRFSPLAADEDLEFGNLYVMFPIRRSSSVVTAADVAVFLMAASSAPKRITSGRISPDAAAAAAAATETASSADDNINGLNLEAVSPGYQYRLSVCRSKRPGLDTILEEPVFLDKIK
ncbi:hypothetical protein AAHA92_00024 [Salvia divinorum]|uniref:DUF4228 domain protein n=1 Tax=Salvia divinorum TaxID=28513 RepID=A0ABD1IKT5_SALDI